MKQQMKLFKLGLYFIAAIGLTSCGNFVEEFTIEEDGSGNYQIYTDVVAGGIEMSVNMAKMFNPEELTPEQEDSLRREVENSVWEDFPGEIDSTIDFASEMPDSLLNYGDNRKYAEKMKGFMRGSREKGYIHGGIAYPFSDIDDLKAFEKFMEESQNSNKEASSGMFGALSSTNSEANYTLNKKGFSRKVTYIIPEDDDSLEKMKKMFGEGTYQTVIHTKRKIKKAKGEHLKTQEDYKVVFEYDFFEALSGKLNTDFEIIFE
jgi:hypothetical protein